MNWELNAGRRFTAWWGRAWVVSVVSSIGGDLFEQMETVARSSHPSIFLLCLCARRFVCDIVWSGQAATEKHGYFRRRVL